MEFLECLSGGAPGTVLHVARFLWSRIPWVSVEIVPAICAGNPARRSGAMAGHPTEATCIGWKGRTESQTMEINPRAGALRLPERRYTNPSSR